MTQEMLAQAHNTFTGLARDNYISLTTFRKTGKAVDTPVWFAEQSGTIYVESGKNGPTVEGKARLLTGAQEIATAEAALSKKYGLTRRMYSFLMNVTRLVRRKPKGESDYIAIEPTGN